MNGGNQVEHRNQAKEADQEQDENEDSDSDEDEVTDEDGGGADEKDDESRIHDQIKDLLRKIQEKEDELDDINKVKYINKIAAITHRRI